MKAMKFLTVFVVALTFATLSNSQTTSNSVEETTTDSVGEGSGTEPHESFTGTTEGGSGDDSDVTTTEPTTVTTTTDLCAEYCGENAKCPDECGDCTYDGQKKSLNKYCAETCTQPIDNVELIWCDGGGEVTTECIVNGDNEPVCGCMPDYYRNEEVCAEAKVFGGIITFDATYNGSDVAGMEENVNETLNAIYGEDLGFLGAEVLNVTEGSIVAKYNLIYDLYSDASDQTVKDSFDTATKNCDGPTSNVTGSVYTINCTSSKDTVIDSSVLCDKYADALNCSSPTAMCDSINGSTTCVCVDQKRYRKPYTSATFCTELTCVANDNDFCNPPFGECVTDGIDQLNNFCQCTVFGWSGSQCEDPWEFVFTIVTAGLGLILIGVLTACICMSRKDKSVKKSSKQEELDLQNPFVDFQPGIVRAKVPSNMYSVSDSYEAPNGGQQSHTNGAYNSAYDDGNARQTSTFGGAQGKPQKNDYEYF